VQDATAYIQFATWAAVDYLARRAVTRAYEAGDEHRKSAGNERGSRDCRVKCKNLWGPSGKNKDWRCEPLSFAYFSLRRQRKVGAAPHRGNASEPITSRGCQQNHTQTTQASQTPNPTNYRTQRDTQPSVALPPAPRSSSRVRFHPHTLPAKTHRASTETGNKADRY
jgi:hypothetical protein